MNMKAPSPMEHQDLLQLTWREVRLLKSTNAYYPRKSWQIVMTSETNHRILVSQARCHEEHNQMCC